MTNNARVSGKALKKSLILATIAGAFGMPFFNIVNGPALTGFTRLMGADDFVYSVIMAVPVVGAIVQVFISYFMMHSGKRKALFLTAGLIHRPVWFLIAFIPLLLHPDKTKAAVSTVTVLITISAIANSVAGMAFNSWMGSLVPPEVKGRFFSRRIMIYTITGGIASLLCGILLDHFSGFSGYALVFVLAAIFGTADIVLYFWADDPPMVRSEQQLSFCKLFVEPFKDRNYLKYTLFVSFWYFSVNIAGPFFNVYMIEEMRMSYLLISLFTQVTANVMTIFFIGIWGRLADKYGSKPVMFLCCCSIFVLPVVWLFATSQTTWVVLLINLFSGIFWPGFEMTASNQSIWLAPEKNRSIYIANYTMVVMLIGTAAAYLCGGAFMQFTRTALPEGGYLLPSGIRFGGYQILFVLSGLFRLLVLLFLFRGYEESESKSLRYILHDFGNLFAGLIKKA